MPDILNLPGVTYLAVATGIDALAVGISLAFLAMPALSPAIVIGIVAAGFSYAGVLLGEKLARVLGSRADIAGGLILCLIGVWILMERTVWA